MTVPDNACRRCPRRTGFNIGITTPEDIEQLNTCLSYNHCVESIIPPRSPSAMEQIVVGYCLLINRPFGWFFPLYKEKGYFRFADDSTALYSVMVSTDTSELTITRCESVPADDFMQTVAFFGPDSKLVIR